MINLAVILTENHQLQMQEADGFLQKIDKIQNLLKKNQFQKKLNQDQADCSEGREKFKTFKILKKLDESNAIEQLKKYNH